MMARLGVEDVILLNDFEALALALTALRPEDLVPIGGDAPTETGAKVVLGPGTGLGVGALVQAGGLWVPVPGEGGHVALGPAEPDEFAALGNTSSRSSGASRRRRCSAGAASCGSTAPSRETDGATADVQRRRPTSPRRRSPAPIRGAVRTIDALCALPRPARRRHGAGLHGARRRLYRRRHPAAHPAVPARAANSAAPSRRRRRTRTVMAAIPIYVIVGETPALHGLAAFARAPERFGVNLTGRRWKK